MKHIIKKLAFTMAALALVTVGAANLYANDSQWPVHQNEAQYHRFLDIRTGGSNF